MTYTSSQAQAGRGGTISIGATPTAIGEVKSLPFQLGKWKFADVTNFESGSDTEVIPTVRDTGSVTVTGNRVSSDAGQTAAVAAYQSGALTSFTLQMKLAGTQVTNGDKYVFNAYVEDYSFDVDVEKAIDMKMTLKLSGQPVFTEGA